MGAVTSEIAPCQSANTWAVVLMHVSYARMLHVRTLESRTTDGSVCHT